jgi:Mg-chelatase subunit ChlD
MKKLTILTAIVFLAACSETQSPTGDGATDTNPGTSTEGNTGDDSSSTGTETEPGDETPTEPETTDPSSVEEDDCDDSFVMVLKPEAGQVAKMMLVVDRSGSMNEETRWADMRAGLASVTTAMEDVVDFGLLLFPSAGIDACGSGQVIVEPTSQSAADIITGMDNWDPLGGTPTYEALVTAGEWLQTNNAGGVNYILLATDGGPGCNMGMNWQTCDCIPGATCMLNGANCLDAVRTSNQVLVLREQGIKTFVVGLPGTEGVTDLLDAMALAGGAAMDGQHISVADQAELTQALSELSASVVPCTFELPFDASTAVGLGFTVDNEPVPFDETETDGWNLSGEQSVTLFGSWCSRMRDGLPHRFEATGNCQE